MKCDYRGVTREMFQQTVFINGTTRVMNFSREMLESIFELGRMNRQELIRLEKIRSFKRNKAHVMCQRRFWS